jgi:hypothetical protein
MADNRAGTHCAAVADFDTGKHHRSVTDPNIVTEYNFVTAPPLEERMIVFVPQLVGDAA